MYFLPIETLHKPYYSSLRFTIQRKWRVSVLAYCSKLKLQS